MQKQHFDGTEASIAPRCEPLYEATRQYYCNDDCATDVRNIREDALNQKIAERKKDDPQPSAALPPKSEAQPPYRHEDTYFAFEFDPDTGITWNVDEKGKRIAKSELGTYNAPDVDTPRHMLLEIIKLIIKLYHELADTPLPPGTLTRLYQELAESPIKEEKQSD